MAIAHVCIRCGWDLAHVRPRREPRYGLNVVRCPRCAGHSARRLHPMAAGWRRFLRMDFAITVLGMRVIIIALLTFLSVIATIATRALWSEIEVHSQLPRGAQVFMFACYGVLAPLIGTFLTAAFEHVALWKVWLGWTAWMALVLLVVSVHGPMDSQFDPRHDVGPGFSDGVRWMLDGVTAIWIPCMFAVFGMMIAALPGIFFGRGLRWLTTAIRSARWRARYRRRRLARAAV